MTNDLLTVLGQIAHELWPHGQVPAQLLDSVLANPVAGLALVRNTDVARAADHDRLQALYQQASTASAGIQMPGSPRVRFWQGYYRYISDLPHVAGFGTAELAKAGHTLYGNQWQSDMARDLGLQDARRIRQWMASERPIPRGIWGDLAGLLHERKILAEQLLGTLTGSVGSDSEGVDAGA